MSEEQTNCLKPSGYRSPNEIIREHDDRRIREGNRAGMTIFGGCRASKSFKMENGRTVTFGHSFSGQKLVGFKNPIGVYADNK